MPVALIYELIGLNYSITKILWEYPLLNRSTLITLLMLGKDAIKNLINVDIVEIIIREV
jgi:hypothetical protein